MKNKVAGVGIGIGLSFAIVLGAMFVSMGCTDNERARHFGGTMTVTLPAGRKLETATWKQDEMWYLTRPMRPNESPETHSFQEKSVHGVWEGTVIFQESR